MDGVHVHMSNTRNTPAEVLETAYPLRVRRYELRTDSGGAGEFRGGLGLRRDVEARGPMRCNLLADRREHAPYGVGGGEDGAPGADHLLADDGVGSDGDNRVAMERLDPKSTRELEAGDVVSIRTPGGGGYGDPAERSVERVRRDLRRGKITAERAQEVYGVDLPRRDSEGSDD
jgi:N-methylhydantoinase B